MNKLLATTLISVGAFSLIGCDGGFSEPIFELRITEDLFSCELAGITNCEDIKSIVLPNMGGGDHYPVVGILEGAFVNCTSLKSLTISQHIHYLGHNVFAPLKSLEEFIVVEENYYYTALDGVLYNKEMTSLIRYPLHKNDKSFAIPDGVTSIESNSFYDCSVIESLYIPATVTNISPGAFLLCSSLMSVEVDPDNLNYSSSDGILYNKDQSKIVYYPEAKPRAQEQVYYDTFKEEFSSKGAIQYSYAEVAVTITQNGQTSHENLICRPTEREFKPYPEEESLSFEVWYFDESVSIGDMSIYEKLRYVYIMDIDNFIFVFDQIPEYQTLSTFYLYPTEIVMVSGGGGSSSDGHSYTITSTQTISYGIELVPEKLTYTRVETTDGVVSDTFAFEGTFVYH